MDDLLARGYFNLSVLDVSPTAMMVLRDVWAAPPEPVHWLVGDITNTDLPPNAYDLWHDRAVFHFLKTMDERAAYVRQAMKTVRSGGHVLVSTFGPEGPAKCSGLEVVRYDTESLHAEFGVHFRLLESLKELHETLIGTTQQFLYYLCRVE